MEQIVKCETGSGGFVSLVSAALEEQSLSVSVVWQLLLAVREAELPLNVLMEEIQKEPGAELFFQAGKGLSLLCTFPTAGRMYFLIPSSPLLQVSQTLSHSFLWCLEIPFFSQRVSKPHVFFETVHWVYAGKTLPSTNATTLFVALCVTRAIRFCCEQTF